MGRWRRTGRPTPFRPSPHRNAKIVGLGVRFPRTLSTTTLRVPCGISVSMTDRTADKSLRVTGHCLERIHAYQRDGETNTATIERALDALEREQALPDAVTKAMEGRA